MGIKYFTINIIGRHSEYSIYPRELRPDYIKHDNWGDKFFFNLESVKGINNPAGFADDLDSALEETEENYPEDTWIALELYDENDNKLMAFEASCEDDYYSYEFKNDIRKVILEFLTTGSIPGMRN